MFDVVSSVEIDAQQVELLPTRTVLSGMFSAGTASGNSVGGLGINLLNIALLANQANIAGSVVG